MGNILKRIVQPLRSRKMRRALATVLAVYAVESGLNVTEDHIFTVIGIIVVGASLILGIAFEDAGLKSAGKKPGEPEC